ncbi:MAG TPA: DUF3618 domain-containing protein [Gordonia sp. (in: high G+C Gram-positive bacteria)]|uniref:DUF3618 domain-containing protein n=1 Tax=unclassified Gordonia (in: high G+C Gram-positive bacteria) TaxID=2657482 RepID=UPI000FA2082A|nr:MULTISPECIES: DUF3618 domain-containing protein [unclassified Gordonia (in: high G+C Gram-positive bacteria)]RUP40800.1 MAG: DUF3618 domain-containing protein [Gordonia sp. (in: high G+C Gram-positive bacteria)]HNP57441.1 DUF3618 domain-containing protein [Gordonia sp. (in: high G+C Gram-positive bacteria)]HRC50864.1 DUF3618 domain-containing protein [Gordonia sp. (in: high G+C Gram-positive bacteria)]
MADDTERIEQEIAQARENLAATLDQLSDRVSPQRLADDAKTRAVDTLNKPAVKYTLIGVGSLTVVVLVRKVTRRRR